MLRNRARLRHADRTSRGCLGTLRARLGVGARRAGVRGLQVLLLLRQEAHAVVQGLHLRAAACDALPHALHVTYARVWGVRYPVRWRRSCACARQPAALLCLTCCLVQGCHVIPRAYGTEGQQRCAGIAVCWLTERKAGMNGIPWHPLE